MLPKLLNDNDPIYAGDTLEIHCKILSVWEQAQIDYIQSQISADPRFNCIGYSIYPSNSSSDEVVFTVNVIETPSPVHVLLLLIAALATALFLTFAIKDTYLTIRNGGPTPVVNSSQGWMDGLTDKMFGQGSFKTMTSTVQIGVLFAFGFLAFMIYKEVR
jgi:hypothetical protein